MPITRRYVVRVRVFDRETEKECFFEFYENETWDIKSGLNEVGSAIDDGADVEWYEPDGECKGC